MIKIDIWPKIPQCPNCGNDMRLDDVDFHFAGCKDEYWYCDYCGWECVSRVRYGKPLDREYYEATGELIKYEHK